MACINAFIKENRYRSQKCYCLVWTFLQAYQCSGKISLYLIFWFLSQHLQMTLLKIPIVTLTFLVASILGWFLYLRIPFKTGCEILSTRVSAPWYFAILKFLAALEKNLFKTVEFLPSYHLPLKLSFQL